MAKPSYEKSRRFREREPREPKIEHETKKSVVAIVLFGLAVILGLSTVNFAGPAGNLLFAALRAFFGIGSYLIPVVVATMGVLLLLPGTRRFVGVTIVGMATFTAFCLGLVDLFFPANGGWVGSAVGLLEVPFGRVAAIVMTSTFALASLLIAFNAALKLPSWSFGKEAAETDEVSDEIIADAEEKNNSEEEDEEREEEKTKPKNQRPTKDEDDEPIIAAMGINAPAKHGAIAIPAADYVPPPLSLLKSSVEKPTSGDLRANANIIKRTLESFGIPVEMGEINIGPKVTRYTLKPAEGVKLTKITALNQDLALALAAHPIRIEAPIPGKPAVGIEVPNKSAAIVRLGSLMAYPEFVSAGPLAIVLGRDVSGEPIFANIEKMPHLLVAGATGSGKSIMIHSIITSLLFKNGPAALKLILIDPKRVELSVYEDLPHLVAPVITESKKSVGVFRWAISEMERRYELLLKAGARDIKSYRKSKPDEPMPYILIVVDEMADLMSTYGREVEGSIVRLAQMARATGIHLLLSTQRPSVEVITGLIKANITSRIALQVASQIDSRTILDIGGAEKLLGGGDLLFISSDFGKPRRIQGAYLSEDEVTSVTKFIREHNEGAPVADSAVAKTIGDLTSNATAGKGDVFEEFQQGEGDSDELYDEALAVVREARKASASLLQRRLKVGYARAARLLDLMEEQGAIGPGDGAKPRDVFIGESDEMGGSA